MKSYAKLNISLKIVGTRGNYHEISSRFIRFNELYDEIFFEKAENFSIECKENIKDNIILKAKNALENAGFKQEIDDFFGSHKILLRKNIPMGAGLGGGSSNAATFLLIANEELNLNLSKEKLMQIAASIGADVPFFISGLPSANISGIGEVIEEFDDEVPNLQLITPNVFCSTPAVYGEFRTNFMSCINPNLAKQMSKMTSKELLENYKNSELNDLYAPCLKLYAKLSNFSQNFLSGSGSSFFRIKNG
ncbi:MAG: 4-(cytidine 5'-diphospho)-2-C-methyl-D-erythritol kinase [Campylobacter sp.]|nr:4-(cytidine 5'-diphospho)-2-C-methyl-D-erythritol kinase [Campylobacter sp.]